MQGGALRSDIDNLLVITDADSDDQYRSHQYLPRRMTSQGTPMTDHYDYSTKVNYGEDISDSDEEDYLDEIDGSSDDDDDLLTASTPLANHPMYDSDSDEEDEISYHS